MLYVIRADAKVRGRLAAIQELLQMDDVLINNKFSKF